MNLLGCGQGRGPGGHFSGGNELICKVEQYQAKCGLAHTTAELGFWSQSSGERLYSIFHSGFGLSESYLVFTHKKTVQSTGLFSDPGWGPHQGTPVP